MFCIYQVQNVNQRRPLAAFWLSVCGLVIPIVVIVVVLVVLVFLIILVVFVDYTSRTVPSSPPLLPPFFLDLFFLIVLLLGCVLVQKKYGPILVACMRLVW
jgi:hypothetical protein